MRALVMAEPSSSSDRTVVADVADAQPQRGEVSIEVAYAGVNFIDVMARRGDPGYVPEWPFVPGLEVAGRVRAVGPGVGGFGVGQPVAAFTRGGGLAEIAVAPADLVVALPEQVPLPLAAAAPLVLSTALLLLTDATHLRAGESVLMHSAAGGVGTAVAQLAGILGGGLRVGTVGRPDKIAGARLAGWDVVLDRGPERAAALAEEIGAAVGGGVDVVLDPSGTALLEVDLAVAAPGARIALFGNAGGGVPAPLPALPRLIGANLTLSGFSMSRLTATAPGRAAAALARVLRLVADGRLQVPVTEVGSLDAAPAIQDVLAAGRGSGKYVVRVGS